MAGNVRVIVFGNVSQSQFWGTDRHCKITRPVSREQRLKKEFVHRPGPGLPFPSTPDQTHSRRGGVFPHCRSFFCRSHVIGLLCEGTLRYGSCSLSHTNDTTTHDDWRLMIQLRKIHKQETIAWLVDEPRRVAGTVANKQACTVRFHWDNNFCAKLCLLQQIRRTYVQARLYLTNYTVSQKMIQLWNGIAQNYNDRFWWYLTEIFRRF